MRHYRKAVGTVALTPGGASSVYLQAGQNLLCEGLDIVVNTSINVTTAFAGGAKVDASGFALKQIAVVKNGSTDWREPGWSAFAGSIERQRQYASLQLNSQAFGLGTDPGSAVGATLCVSTFVVDFSTPDSLRPKDSALDLDALGAGGVVEIQLTGASVGDFYNAGAGAGSITSQTATVYARMTVEDGTRGGAGPNNWRPPAIKKRKQVYTIDVSTAGVKEQRLPSGGLMRGFVLRQNTPTVSPVYTIASNVRLESQTQVFLDMPAFDLITSTNRDRGKPLFAYGIYDAATIDGSGNASLVECIDTKSAHPSPMLYVTTTGFAGGSVDVVVTDYVAV